MGGNCVKLNPANGSQPQMQNWRKFDTVGDNNEDKIDAAKFEENAKAIADMVYGSGLFEGRGGGRGHVGIVGDKVIKFNTKKKERDELEKMKKLDTSIKANSKEIKSESNGFVTYQDMKESCNNLRRQLLKMAEFAGLKDDDLAKVLDALKIKANGTIGADADLLERKTVADILKKLVSAYNETKAQAKILNSALWGGHTPTYGSSVASFRDAINKHNENISLTVTKEYDDLVKDAVRVSDGIDQTRDAIADRIRGKVDGWCTHVNGWLNRTRDFLIGLVPETANDAKALRGLCETLDEHCRKIKEILKEMKDLAAQPPEDGKYKPEKFGGRDSSGRKEVYSRFSKVVSLGFKEVNFQFDSMLHSAHLNHTFSDGNRYPNFTQSLSGQKIPKAYEDIADDISVMCQTFRNAIDSFVFIEDNTAKAAGEKVDFKNWNEKFDQRVGNAANAFDKTLEGLVGSANGSNRTEMLKVIMNPPNEQQKNQQPGKLKALAQSLKDMWKATIAEDKCYKFNTTFNPSQLTYYLKDQESDLDGAINNIKNVGDFTKFVDKLIQTRSSRSTVFDMSMWGNSSIPAAVPRGLVTGQTPALFRKMRENGEDGKMIMTAMRYFNRLHEVASAFGVIDAKTGVSPKDSEKKIPPTINDGQKVAQ